MNLVLSVLEFSYVEKSLSQHFQFQFILLDIFLVDLSAKYFHFPQA